MAAAETARLIAELTLKDKLTPGVKSATASLGKLDSSLGRMGATAKRGASVAGKALLGLGAVAAVGIGAGIKTGLENLATLESAVTSVDGAIKQVGLTGQVTGAQIAAMANQIESDIGAAFDDKDITQAATTLIRFGKVTTATLEPALVVMTDLATKTGSVESAATLLAKALADPEKAAGKLARTGVILTKEEQKQIKAFMKAGKAAEAQKVILDSLAKSTKGAAAASQGPYQRALSTLADVTEDAQKALGEGFLPVIERVAKWLSTSLADPKVMADIRSMGKSLAGAFDDAVTFAQKVPWGAIKDGLKTAAEWAGRLFDAFRSMPPEMQATIVALAGLNKLSGGAISGIVSELGKGLVRGVLGLTAGVVNLKAATVIGGGGPSVPGGKGGGVPGLPVAGGLGVALTAVIAPASIIALGAAVSGALLYGVPAVVASIYGKPKPEAGVNATSARDPGFQAMRQVNALLANVPRPIVAAVKTSDANQRGEQAKVRAAIDGVKQKQAESIVAFRAAERAFAAGQKPPIVNVSTGFTVNVDVSAANVNKSVTVRRRYGTTGGSRDVESGHGK